MKIKIQYPAGPNITPAQIEVETDDSGLEPSEQLQHASDALDVALKVVWAEKARPTEPASKVEIAVDGLKRLAANNESFTLTPPSRDDVIKTMHAVLMTATDADGRPLFRVELDPGE